LQISVLYPEHRGCEAGSHPPRMGNPAAKDAVAVAASSDDDSGMVILVSRVRLCARPLQEVTRPGWGSVADNWDDRC